MQIVLDVLPSQASSVPCEWLFFGTKQIPVDHCACLGMDIFEELVIMWSAWGPSIYNMAAWTSSQEEEVDFFNFEVMLVDDAEMVAWEKDSEEEEIDMVE